MLKIGFENLGYLTEGEVEINNLTLFCGENNTGKTYALYSIYGLLDKEFEFELDIVKEHIKNVKNSGIYEIDLKECINKNFFKILKKIENSFKEQLHLFFSIEDEMFKNTKIQISLNKDNILKRVFENEYGQDLTISKNKKLVFNIKTQENSYNTILTLTDDKVPNEILENSLKDFLLKTIFEKLFINSFLLPAERTGLNLFYKELNSTRNALFNHIQKSSINPLEVFKDMILSRYPQPIDDYITFLNETDKTKKNKSKYIDFAKEIQKTILNGKYSVEKDGVHFMPYRSNNTKLNLHLASSTAKSFFGLVFYLEHIAQKGNCIFIDEPELNLHPDNQRKIARILAKLSNSGIKVLISTHSDYIIREINNLIMLNDDFPSKQKLLEGDLKKCKYNKDEFLDIKNISAYLFHKNRIEKMNINSEEGIYADTFDKIANDLNQYANDIYYTKKEDLDNE